MVKMLSKADTSSMMWISCAAMGICSAWMQAVLTHPERIAQIGTEVSSVRPRLSSVQNRSPRKSGRRSVDQVSCPPHTRNGLKTVCGLLSRHPDQERGCQDAQILLSGISKHLHAGKDEVLRSCPLVLQQSFELPWQLHVRSCICTLALSNGCRNPRRLAAAL